MFNILLCGLGSIGKRHARLIRQNFPHRLYALRTRKGQEIHESDIPEISSWREVDDLDCHVALITNPTFLHIQTALECAKRGMHLFLEKPIDSKLDGLEELLSLIEKNRLTSYVAYPLRFDPITQEVRTILKGCSIRTARMVCSSNLADWRPGQNHLSSYSAFRDQGGGALLDLSHELDLADWLFGPVLKSEGRLGRVSRVTVDAEDVADLLLSHSWGVTNVHLDFCSRRPQRYFEVEAEGVSLRADLVGRTLRWDGDRGEGQRSFPLERDDLYLEQLRFFFSHLDNPKLDNNLFEASRLFRQMIHFRSTQMDNK